MQFRLIFKSLLSNGRAHFLLDTDDTPIVYKFSPTSQASLEEKRVSVWKSLKVNFLFFCDSFLLLRFIVRPDENVTDLPFSL